MLVFLVPRNRKFWLLLLLKTSYLLIYMLLVAIDKVERFKKPKKRRKKLTKHLQERTKCYII